MRKRIAYFVQNYRPESEAVSKEVKILSDSFNSSVFDMSFRNPLNYPRLLRLPFLSRDISHIYTSLGDRPYLTLLRRKPIILTGSSSARKGKIESQLRYYSKLSMVVVESERQRSILYELGVDDDKIKLIYPGINLDEFSHKPSLTEGFTVLFASSPPREELFDSRGINLLLSLAGEEKSLRFIFLWRKTCYDLLRRKIEGMQLSNVEVVNEIVGDMNEYYAKANCTITPFMNYDDHKPVPRSLIESLAAGKPVLVSNRVGISNMIEEERCGVVFEPDPESLIKAVSELRSKYKTYQKNTGKPAEKYFSKKGFITSYEELYKEIS